MKNLLIFKSSFCEKLKLIIIPFLLLTLGVGQMWAEPSWPYASLYEVYMTYSYNGTTGNYTYKSSDSGHGAVALGTLTADFKITSIYMKVYKNENDWGHTGNICHAYLKYNISGGAEQSIEPTSWSSGTWADERHKYEISKTSATTIASYNSGASGNYTFSHYFKADGDDNGSNCNDYSWYISNNSANYSYTYSIAPPAISSFSVAESGYISGSGTSEDPYIMPYNGTLTLTVSGSKGRTDANSTIKYWKNSGSKGTDNVLTVTGITSTTKTSVVVHAQCINNSSSSLVGTESTKTVYYKSEAAYSVTVSSGAHGSVSPSGAQSNIGTLSGLSVSATPSTGYNFNTWTISSGSGSFTSAATTASNKFKPTAASTITASFTAKQTTVTLSANAPGGQTVTGGGTTVTATYDAALPSFSALTCTGGYALKGYYTNTSGGTKVINADGSFNANSGIWNRLDGATLTLHAQWSLDRTLTYSGNGNTSGSVPADPAVYANGASVTVLGNTNSLVKTGYTFNNWNTEAGGGGSSYSAGNTITMNANYTLYAQWRENNYTVTVNAGSNGSVASGSVTGHYDTKVTLPTATANTGYHFSTWTTTSGSLTYTNQTSATEAQVNGLTAAATVRADFAANTYSVVFNKNGGTGTMSNESFTYGVSKALTSNSFTRSGYTFLGWATSTERATALTVDYTNGQSVSNLTSTNGGTFNLYAVWAKKYYIGGRFQHDWEDGSSTTNEMTYVSDGRYKLVTSKTVSELSVQWHNVSGDYYADQLFFIHAGSGKSGSSSNPFYTTPNEDGAGLNFETSNSYANALVLKNQETTWGEIVTNRLVQFSNVDNLSSNVIVWWEPSTKKIWYEATTSLNTNYYLLGFGSGSWGETDARRFKVASVNATTATVSVSLTAKTYTYNTNDGFKLENGGTYYGNNGTMERGNCTGWVFETGDSYKNCGIIADLAGTYTFTLNLSTKAISVTYPTAYQLNYSIGSVAGTSGSISTSPTTASGSYVASGNTVTLTGPAAKTGYTWKGWYTNAAGTEGKIADVSRAITITMDADKNLYACYTENNYTVTVNAGAGGTVASGSVTGHKDTKVTLPTATANLGYYFTGWTVTSGTATLTSASSATAAKINGMTDAVTVTANFASKWGLFSSINSWGDPTPLGNYSTSASKDYGYVEVSLAANTEYSFKIRDFENSSNYKPASDSPTKITYSNKGTAQSMTRTAGGDPNQTILTAGAGTYRFTWNITDKSIKVTYPTAYTITFGKGTGGATITATGSASGTLTSGNYVASGEDVTFTQTASSAGYTFTGWYTTKDTGGSAVSGMGVSDNVLENVTANKTVYSRYSANTYTITLTRAGETGYGSGGTANVTATYNAALPTIASLPTAAAGYAFMGYYTDHNGGGTQWYGADGSKKIASYTTIGGTTLYAYFKPAAITALTFDAASVEASGEVGVTPTIDPVPEPTVSVCWRVLYDNDNPLSPQPEISWDGTKATFTAPAASGTFKVEAKLYNSGSCGSGTLLSTQVANFTVAGIHTVTVQYKCGEDDIKASTTTTGRPFDWSDAMTAPEIFGYTFSNWTAGTGVTLTDDNGTTTKTTTTNATIKIKATYNGTLTANYTQKSIIYFKNTLGWSDVYVNFYTVSDWDSSDNGSGSQKGAGNNGVTNRNKHMTQIGSTDVWYYDYGYNDGGSSITPSLYVSFTSASQDNVNEFWATNPGIGVVYPTNYPDAIDTDKSSENGFKAATPMFVPLSTQEAVAINVGGGGRANYYNAGYWTKYLPGTGYTLEIYNSGGSYLKSAEFTSGDELMPMKAVVDLEAGQTYKYILRRGGTGDAGINYGNTGTMTYSNHGQGTAWEMINTMAGGFQKAGITTNAAGNYTFNLSYAANASTEYRLRMEVDYPVASGDYRVIYKHTGQANYKASAIVQKVNNGKDTVSFFIKPGSSPSMKIQRATVAANGTVTWNDYSTITSSVSGLAKDSVYNICLTMNGSGVISVENVEVYTGNFYIRTDAANSKWDNYRSDPDHLMTFSEYSITHGGYSHYYCHWVQAGTNRKNVKFCIANDYSPSISDTLARETASGTWANIASFISEGGDILRNANVRFTWNQHDNTISRAYVDGAQEDGSRFLVISSTDGKIKKADGSALSNNEVTFSDNENWIYEANVKAQPKAAYRLISTWGTGGTVITQYFKGSSTTTETLIDGSGSTWYDIRLLYDFKTNRLVAAWVPSDATITENNAINADVMFIREHQGDIAQLTFNASGQISAIKTAYGVLKFNKWTLANKEKTGGHSPLAKPASVYERSLFWISFPFRVKLSEVFGFGTYGTHWAIQRYDGAKRAEIGHFAENGSFWRWMSRNTEYLEPNQGYLLAIDLDLLGESSDVWGPESRSEQIELYFPSYGDMPNISNASVAQTIPSHECTINRATGVAPLLDTGDPRTSYNRTIFDSHWNVLSVPTYVNTTAVSYANTTWTAAIGPKFLYTWNASDNTITATTASGYTYHAMHSYMVQYAGNLTWTASSGSPASIVARKTYAETPKEVEFRLELQQNKQEIDRTFVVLSNDEEVSADFQFGEDMTKEFNAKKSAIYTFIADEAVAAGNTLPMSEQTTVVPVGVDIKADGDYTFAMPDGTSGVGVVLIDNETGIRTSLSALDYTVFLEAGTYDKRFMMEISPIKQGTTGIDLINGDASANGVRKLLIDQKMYIIKGDKMYDATGRRVE